MAAEDRADTYDDLKYYTEQIAPALEAGGIKLLATNAETVYVELPNHTLLAGGDVLLHDGEWRVERADVTVRDGRIQAVGLTPGRADRKATPLSVRDCSGCLIIPGLIQAHIHLCQTLFRGLADDLPLEQWLARRIWPLEAAHTEDSVYWSAMLGAAELLLGGTTAILDMETVHHTQ